MMSNVLYRGFHSSYDFLSSIQAIDNLLAHKAIQSYPIRLIVVDSVAAMFRTDFNNNQADYKERIELQTQISTKFRQWSQMYNLPVVVTNHVVDFVRSYPGGPPQWEGLITSGGRVLPALGQHWTRCIQGRIFMSREIDGQRQLKPIIGNYFQDATRKYHIVEEGVFAIDED
jgi:DNA-repair protein XRCC3